MASDPGFHTCNHCKFFMRHEPGNGVCFRYPPTGFPVGPDQIKSVRPIVRDEHFCGEWTIALIVASHVPKMSEIKQ